MITIRKATITDLPLLMPLFEEAKQIMRQDGNMNQWTKGYPDKKIILNDIQQGYCHVCLDENGHLIGSFAFIVGNDPTYKHIYQGNWINNDQPYGTIHRLASTPQSHGVAAACINWCSKQINNLRADTHRDNRILQHILQKHGFSYCGIIYLLNGDERLAFQRICIKKDGLGNY